MAWWKFIGSKRIFTAWIGLVLGLSMSSSSWARNPWSSEVGDARAVQSKTEDIAERLRDKFPFCPATSIASHLDQSANQLESLIEQGASWYQVQSALRQTRSLSGQTHRAASADRHVREDGRLMNYFGELNRRLDKLDQELREAYAKSSSPDCLPDRPHGGYNGGYQSGYHGGHPGSFAGDHPIGGVYPDRPSHYPSWNGPSWNGPSRNGPSWDRPNGNPPAWGTRPSGGQLEIHYQSNRLPTRNAPTVGRQVLSSVLNELVNGL
ncbi:hypothetical protein VN12_12760 [Pirellula sp. SH-Sr6A]|uniref:hypothetical protein n=1 Tax=Pirellula sp. SH-Sr6A TaxID=1632865 RepID=UPI00078CC4D9|nr:hypothetical protein [Pirellula sp. SH-Sr6A]AMV32988.1 hypothetical protein VN12_12760 [Pirellula sp. SH-Sr6A]